MGALDELLQRSETFEEAKGDTITEIINIRQGQSNAFQMRQELPDVIPATEGQGFVESFQQGFAVEPQTRLRMAAEAMFPDDPEAINRFGFIEGDMVFVNDQGRMERVSGGAADLAGRAAAMAPEVGGAIAGTFTPMPVLGSAGGAMVGRAFKRLIGNLVLDEPQTPGGVATDIALEGGLAVVGGGAGKVVSGLAGRRAVRGIDERAIAGAPGLRAGFAATTGIELDLAQVTNLPKIKALKLWARNFPGEASEIVRANDEVIAGQSQRAIQRVLDVVSAPDDAARVGIRGINAAEASIIAARTEVADRAGPLYRQAFEAGGEVNLKPVLDLVTSKLQGAKGSQAASLRRVRTLLNSPQKKTTTPGISLDTSIDAARTAASRGPPTTSTTTVLDTSVRGLHATKLAIDEMLERRGTTALGRTTRRDLVEVKKALLDQISEASPVYDQARQLFAAETRRLVVPLQESIIGVLSKINNQRAATAAATMFNNGNVTAQSIRSARTAIQSVERATPELDGAWNGLVRQWLEDQFVRASRELQTGEAVNIAGKFRQRIIGTPQQKAAMVEALGADAIPLFDMTMDALAMVARTPTVSSATEFNRLITEELRGSAGSITRAVMQPRATAINAIDDRFLQNQSVRIAEALTDPSKVSQLRALKELRPSTNRSLIVAGVVGLGIVPREIASDMLNTQTQLPPILQQSN